MGHTEKCGAPFSQTFLRLNFSNGNNRNKENVRANFYPHQYTDTHTHALISHNTGPFDVGGTFSHLLPSEQGSFPFELLISFAPPPLCVCEEAIDRDRERENVSQA